ncbi:unnamed protein product [Wickerhamomyces anomalus]
MLRCYRSFSTSGIIRKKYQLTPGFDLKCGLEIHSQLDTTHKLFSLSKTSFQSSPNSKISYFDASLPGTQPTLNPEPLLFALKAAKALNSDINTNSTFDRKHYFYGDQPMGYQITQHYQPYAKNGFLKLLPHDGVEKEKIINIEQIQIEQDTGKSVYTEFDNQAFSKIDLNRTNTPLIELVTKPDFTNPEEIRIFIKKFQNLVRHLKICTGDLETGAMRVDVNISINNGHRVELKNLSTTSAVIQAVKYEYQRQIDLVKSGESVVQETRGWNGAKTVRLRTKEAALDYRYMPDPELASICLEDDIETKLVLPKLPDALLDELRNDPYNLSVKDATILTHDLQLLDYYFALFGKTVLGDVSVESKLPGNWLIHELLGGFTKLNLPFDQNLISVDKLSELLIAIQLEKITKSSAKLLLQHLMNNPQDLETPILNLIQEFDLGKQDTVDLNEIDTIVQDVMTQHENIVQDLQNGKKLNSIKFLIGQCMRQSQGKIKPNIFENRLKEIIGI